MTSVIGRQIRNYRESGDGSMLYLTGVWNYGDEEQNIYYLFETQSYSRITGNRALVTDLIEKYKLEVKNLSLHNGKLKIKQWPNGIRIASVYSEKEKTDLILLHSINRQRFRMLNKQGNVHFCSEDGLKSLIDNDRVANCCVTIENGVKCYKSEDTYSISTKDSFRQQVDLKYKEFQAKTLVVGLDMSFNYEIENRNVRITSYTGRSTRVIIPSFITTINSKIFESKGIIEIRLSEGLEYIGDDAFRINKIQEVVIPKSVKIIGHKAFFSNNGELVSIKLLSDKTLVVDNTL